VWGLERYEICYSGFPPLPGESTTNSESTEEETNGGGNSVVIIGASVGGAVLIVGLLSGALVAFRMRKRKTSPVESGKDTETVPPNESTDIEMEKLTRSNHIPELTDIKIGETIGKGFFFFSPFFFVLFFFLKLLCLQAISEACG
jgi:hypothetical protein